MSPLERAMTLAAESSCRFQHGALVVGKGGRILGSGVNRSRNSPTTPGVPRDALSYHAEERALRAAGMPRGATVVVARVNRLGEPRPSAPCTRCAALIESLRGKVVHT